MRPTPTLAILLACLAGCQTFVPDEENTDKKTAAVPTQEEMIGMWHGTSSRRADCLLTLDPGGTGTIAHGGPFADITLWRIESSGTLSIQTNEPLGPRVRRFDATARGEIIVLRYLAADGAEVDRAALRRFAPKQPRTKP